MGSPLLTEDDLREERSWIEQTLPPLGTADKDGDHRMEVSIDPLGGWSQGSQLMSGRPAGMRSSLPSAESSESPVEVTTGASSMTGPACR